MNITMKGESFKNAVLTVKLQLHLTNFIYSLLHNKIENLKT